MRTFLGFLVLGIMLSGISARAGPSDGDISLKGYITFGDNIVVIPGLLQKGDRLIVTTDRGMRIFDRTIGTATTRYETLNAEKGVYSVWWIRSGEMPREIRVPVNAY